jgi:hypothetical protein
MPPSQFENLPPRSGKLFDPPPIGPIEREEREKERERKRERE